ncbi:DUF6959 family protein [Myxococcus sp. AM010]|uniref:DUF6959 family protein n=1 Tax=Myxococcus sp. AM010 TaxID=2745138 RepID=UPI0038B283B6
MAIVEMELFTDQGNNAVVRLPERKYPGVVIQGDMLNSLVTTTFDAIEALSRSDLGDAQDLLRELAAQLQTARERYEAALRDHRIELPY